MLGIRYCRLFAVDLWQGDTRDFVCDQLVSSCLTQPFELSTIISTVSTAVHTDGLRHIAIQVPVITSETRQLPEQFFAALAAFADQTVGESVSQPLRRITVIIDLNDDHDCWYKSCADFFAEFPLI